jgi:phosphoribosylanthranilate isomerase
MTTAVKICGITRVEDALAASRLGAHAIGLVFYAGSARYVHPDQAAAIVRALPPLVTPIGLFVNPELEFVARVVAQVPLSLLQFHGDESPEFCERVGRPYIKAVRVKPGLDLLQYAQRYAAARGLLLDAFVEHAYGGTGTAFDWSLVPQKLTLPVILSGGLNAANVAAAIRRIAPSAVDVSSGVESAPGIKDSDKMAAFFESVRNATL